MRVGNIQNNISFQRTQAFIVNPKEEKEFRERLEEKFPQEEWNYSIEDFTKFFYDKVDAFIFASEKPGYGEYGYTLMKAAGMERKVLVVLTGVDTASYARDGMLISDVCAGLLRDVPGIQRLRISSFDPASPQVFKIIDLMHTDSRMMPHMHLSMQSGSDTILRAMRRRHTADSVRKIVEYAGRDITFSWDIICGFPGETDELFRETMDLVRHTRPIKVHAFPFSARPGTVAAEMPNDVNRAVARARVHEITSVADAIRLEFMNAQVGQYVPVLVEENNVARTPHDISVKISGDKISSRTICDVKIVGIAGDMYIGERV